ncbi:MAG: GGDEF domain-containing phosphodiesterase, partial [Halofilum sp. (in: g-proteobacteria)]
IAREPDPMPFARRARELATHIADKLREPLIVHGYERRVGVSIGISLYPEHGEAAELLIDKADTAMYGAKVGGSSSRIALYEPSMSQERRQRLSLEARLHRAVDGDELDLCYQPMVELGSGQIVGVEALLRWPQADGSFVAPSEFIPVAEETGLITGIGEWVLDTASRQIAEWRAQSLAIPVAVNISPGQLQLPGDHRRFADLVSPHVEPEWVELEVTESLLMANPEATESTLRAFTEQGFRLAIDDFGTGYSSLTRLQHLPIQTLKIDKAFVADLGRTRSGEGIVHSIIELARSLSIRPLAEGIETDGQRSMLLAEGCRWGQGHWFSHAVPADELVRLVRGEAIPPQASRVE